MDKVPTTVGVFAVGRQTRQFASRMPPMVRTRARLLAFAAAAAVAAMAGACGGTPQAVTTSATSPQAVTPSSAKSVDTYAARLTFAGGLSGNVTGAQAPPSGSSNACGAGSIDVEVVLNGQNWALDATASAFHGPGEYKAGLGSEFDLMMWSPTNDIWTTTAGSATYSDDKSLHLDVDVTNLMVGAGDPHSTAHVSGSISCA
jgi:hypothetical protein